MISSIVWIICNLTGYINPEYMPWKIYIPICIIEIIVYFKLVIKIWGDR